MREDSMRFALMLAALLSAGRVWAGVIDAVPGPGTPLQDAIDAAAPGDTVRLRGGFAEAIVIDKPLKLRGPGYTDAGCITGPTLRVLADGVSIQRVYFYGGGAVTVDVSGRDHFKMTGGGPFPGSYDVVCPGSRDYGVLVQNSTNVRVKRLFSPIDEDAPGGYATAYIALRDIPPGARVQVSRIFSNRPHAANVLVENTVGTTSAPFTVVISRMRFLGCGAGIVFHGAGGLAVLLNQISGCTGPGIDLDATSDGNLIARNSLSGNVPDVRDLGTGNCWSRNEFTTGTVSPCP